VPFGAVTATQMVTLEYACHVRDVFTVQRARLDQALSEERPSRRASIT
jgi:hypothetical protein